MASFTDKIIEFNPHISQLPVDDYMRVGMLKQQQYEEGVQKVQQYIDNVRGIEVVKDEHRQYLNATLQNLQGEVSGIVSADFSNHQLVSQVGRLTNRLVADPIIQNALVSTTRYKKALAEQQKAKAEGKSSVVNDYNFENQATRWLSDGDAKSPFSGSYRPYRDVRKKMLDIIKAVDPNSRVTQIPFVRNGDGTYLMDENGRPKLDQVMMEIEYKGKSYEDIKRAIEAGLDEDDIEQLKMEGTYHFKDHNPTSMKKVVETNYKARVDDLNKMLTNLKTQKMVNPTDNVYQANVDRQIKEVEDRGANLNRSYAQDIDFLSISPEDFKSEFYKYNYLDQVGKAFSSASESFKYLDNPYIKRMMEEKEFNLKYQRFIHDSQYDALNYEIKLKELSLREREIDKKNKEESGFVYDVALSLAALNDAQKPTEAGFQDDIKAEEAQLIAAKASIIDKVDHLSKLPSWEAEKELVKLRDSWEKGGKIADNRVAEYFADIEFKETEIKNRKYSIMNIQAKAAKNPTLDVNKVVGGGGLRVGNTTYNPSEMVNFTDKLDKLIKKGEPLGQGMGTDYKYTDDVEAAKVLTPKEMDIYNIYKKSLRRADVSNLSPGVREVVEYVDKTRRTLAPLARKVIKARGEFFANEIAAIDKDYQPEAYIIDAGKHEKLYKARGIINAFLVNPELRGGGVGKTPNFDYDETVKANNDEKSTYGVYKIGAESYVTVKGGKSKTQFIPITPGQLNSISEGAFSRPFDPIQKTIALSGDRATTNVIGEGAKTAYLSKSSFPGVTQYGVKADVEQAQGGYQIKFYIYNPKTNTWVTRVPPGLYSDTEVVEKLRNVGDLTIKQLLGQ